MQIDGINLEGAMKSLESNGWGKEARVLRVLISFYDNAVSVGVKLQDADKVFSAALHEVGNVINEVM